MSKEKKVLRFSQISSYFERSYSRSCYESIQHIYMQIEVLQQFLDIDGFSYEECSGVCVGTLTQVQSFLYSPLMFTSCVENMHDYNT